jgi:hypothetical protein
MQLLPTTFADPALAIFADTKWLNEFSKVRPGLDRWRVRFVLIDALNLCGAVEEWADAHQPTIVLRAAKGV